ncbi:MAG: YIP1 family protein [Pseudomonadota bacterium]
MNAQTSWQGLVVQSVTAPKEAASQVLSWRLSPEVLWQALALVAIINAILSTLSNFIVPLPDPLSGLMMSPTLFAIVVAIGLIGTVFVLSWIGNLMGGTGNLYDIMALLIWLQALRAMAQLVLLILMMVMPVVATLFVLFVTVATLWIFINFVQVGLGLRSIGQAIGAVIAAATGIVLGLSLLLSLFGVGISANV